MQRPLLTYNYLSLKLLRSTNCGWIHTSVCNKDASVSSSQISQNRTNSSKPNDDPYTNKNGSLTKSNGERLDRFMQLYEDFVGLTEVKQAQDKVVMAEHQFLRVQEDRRAMQQDIISVQTDVRAVGAELEKTNRTESKYIDLVKKEHEILLIEKKMANNIKALDKEERDYFSSLSAAVRESHEKERARAEKTKYWSIIGSVVGAIIGIVGSTWNNHRRMKELRAIVSDSGEITAEYKAIASQVMEDVSTGQNQLVDFVNSVQLSANSNNNNLETSKLSDSKLSYVNQKQFEEHSQSVLQSIHSSSVQLQSQLKEIQGLISLNVGAKDPDNSIVYVGPQIEDLLAQTETKLQDNFRKNVLVATVAVGGCVSVGVALIAFILSKGS